MKDPIGYKEEIDGRRYLIVPLYSGATTKEVLKRINSALCEYMDANYRESGYICSYGTRRYPWARLHALFPEKIVYEVEV